MRRVFRSLLAALLAQATPALAADTAFPKAFEQEIALAKDSMMSDQAAALRHVGAAERLANAFGDATQRALGLATARWLAAEANLRSSAPEKAEPLLKDGLRLIAGVEKPIKLRGDLLMSRGALFMQRNEAVKALADYQEAFRIFAQVNEPRSQSIALQNIGALYSVAKDDARAEQYYRQAAEQFDGDPVLSLALHNSRGNVLGALERYPEAAREYGEALRIARSIGKPLLEARMLVNLARAQIDMKQFGAADRNLTRGFNLIRGANADLLLRQLFATSARLAADQGDSQTAARLIGQAFDGVDLETTSVDFRNAHNYAREIFARVGEERQALQHLQALKRLDDQSAKVATTTGAALMAARFNFAEQQARIQQMKAEAAERTTQLLYATVGATLAVIVMLAWALVTIRRSRNEVRDANVVLNDTNVALEKALKAKTEFLATTSHEIRTPLNGILGMTQVMLADPRLEAQTRDRIGIVHGAGTTMRALVDDILDVAKMETGNLVVYAAPMDLCAMLRDVTRLWDEQARAKGLQFRLELSHAPHWIVSDSGRLRQIVFNLLSNAIKFTAKGSVSLRVVEEGEGDARRLKMVVQDSGIGIPAEKFGEIFESFRQVDAGTTRQFGGTGLGLTICRNLAEALGGGIRVESQEGEGTRFIVDLPLVLAEAPAQAEAGGPSGAGTMLIVERNPIARSMLRTLLEPRVAALRFASSTAEALDLLAAGPVTHLLLDEATLKAGDADPFGATAMLSQAAIDAQVIVFWQNVSDTVRLQLAEAGAHEILAKPVSGAALVEAIVTPLQENSGKKVPARLVSQAA